MAPDPRLETLATLATHAPVGLLLEDGRGRIHYCNPALVDMLGLPPDTDLVGLSCADLARMTKDAVADTSAFLAATEATLDDTWDVVMKDGRTLELQRTPDQSSRKRVWSLHDVSRRRHREQQRLDRTRAASVIAMAAGLADSLSDHLTAIVTKRRTELGVASPANDPMLDSARQAIGLISRIRTFLSRPACAPRRIDASLVVDEVAGIARYVVGPLIRLRCAGTDREHWLRTDPARLASLLVDLVIEARDQMPSGGELTLRVETVSLEATDGALDDSGSGRAVVLEVTHAGAPSAGGTAPSVPPPGWSPPGVEGRVHGLGGRIDRARATDGASVACLTFPAAPLPTVAPGDGSPTRGRGAWLLLVEDEDIVRSVLEEALALKGYRVTSVADAYAALDVVATNPDLDLMITDATMPGLSGPELADRVRALRPDLTTLLISGYVGVTVETGNGLPFLQKPFMPEQLMAKVAELLADEVEDHVA